MYTLVKLVKIIKFCGIRYEMLLTQIAQYCTDKFSNRLYKDEFRSSVHVWKYCVPLTVNLWRGNSCQCRRNSRFSPLNRCSEFDLLTYVNSHPFTTCIKNILQTILNLPPRASPIPLRRKCALGS